MIAALLLRQVFPMLALTLYGATEHLPEDDQDAAMRRYWDAKQAGDATARLVRIEDLVAANGPPPTPNPTPDPDDDPPPSAPGAVSGLAFARIRRDEAWLADAGFALRPPVYAPGTRVLPVGDANFRTERQRVEGLPPFPGAAAAVEGTIRLENRADVSASVRDVAMNDYGNLVVGETEYALEHGAFLQLALHLQIGMGARYLVERCDRELRAENVNHQLRKFPDKALVFRTRAGPEDEPRRIYATVTRGYTPVDTDAVLKTVLPCLTDARAELVYDGSGMTATALFMPDHVVDLAAGDIFKAGVRIRTDDTGRGRVRIAAVVWRNLCLNLLIIDEGEVETVSEVHRGDPARILAAVALGVEAARAKIATFLDAWGHARTVKVHPTETIRQWVATKKLTPRTDKERDHLVDVILGAWEHEPGNTLADAVNAVSRAAHETPSFPMDFREQLERQAARLVLVEANR
jgi:hypothetical protein